MGLKSILEAYSVYFFQAW